MDCVIVGGGPAGIHAALQCRQSWPGKTVALLEAGEELGYCNPMLPQYMGGQVEEEKLFFWRPAEDPLFQLRTGVQVQSLERASRSLRLSNGEELRYERLILAPGGRAIVPFADLEKGPAGIFPVRTLAPARKIREWIPTHREIVVLGGGLVGIKTAVYLSAAGFKISIVEKEDHILPQALSPSASKPIEEHLHRLGIRLYLGNALDSFDGAKGALTAVKAGGRTIPCETLLLAIGSVPNIGFLDGSNLVQERAIQLSSTLQTSDPNIFAAGDAVAIAAPGGIKVTPWTWPQAVTQGKLAAANLYGPEPVPIQVLTRVNSMNLQGLALAVLGVPVPGAEIVSWTGPGEGSYREIFLRDGRIVGGALVGNTSGATRLHTLMINGETIGPKALELLRQTGRVYARPLPARFPRQRRVARFFSSKEMNP